MMIGFAVLSTSSLAVASFAWFTSNQKATVSTTQLKVQSGLQFKFYAYLGNFKNNDSSNAVTGYQTSTLNNGFDNDFVEITDDSWTTMSNMYPGDKLTFAIEVSGITTEIIGLDVKDFNGGRSNTLFAIIEDADVPIEITWAMDLFGDSSSDPSYYTRFVAGEAYELDEDDNPVALEDTIEPSFPFGSAVPDNHDEHAFTVMDTDRIANEKTYLFYTLCFSNEPTTYFTSYNNSTTRYVHSDSGTSDVYKGLSFAITQLEVREGSGS